MVRCPVAGPPYHGELLEDPHDERLFVNYLGIAFEHFPDGPIHHQLLVAHSGEVRRCLRTYEFDTRVRQKYEWIATYHNYVCRTFANQYLVHGDEASDPEEIAIGAEAQRVLGHLVPFEGLPAEQTPRPLDAQRLQQRLATV